jgi:UDP-N-acetylmuramyl pentapeptide synthase
VAYLHGLARLYLRRRRPGVIAIAGNRGKTVLKRVLARALSRAFLVRTNPRSYNTEIGLPLAVLGLEINPRSWRAVARTLGRASLRALFHRERLDWLILELGSRRPGDMAQLLRTVRPDWAVVTNVASGEGELAEQAAVLREEVGALLAAVPPGRVLMSEDDPLLQACRGGLAVPPIPLGRARSRPGPRGGAWFAAGLGEYRIGPELVGESAAYAVQAAVLLGERLGMARAQLEAFLLAETGAAPPETGPPETASSGIEPGPDVVSPREGSAPAAGARP